LTRQKGIFASIQPAVITVQRKRAVFWALTLRHFPSPLQNDC
jgi:hypothetical protein